MSRFAKAMARANRVLAENLSDGLATYRRANGETIAGVPYTLELETLVYDDPESGVGRFANTIEVPVAQVPKSGRGDVVITADRRWEYLNAISDDGDFRRFEVM
ncbi:hypothetical protein [Salinicola sp. CPA57]|uniref:hypothetical protein n=1 Tax=Salinicola sp. CPA57 TaxID=1949080 RepID=UPI000DA1BA27|nr:hypothetical protein [Salinicola sp. CPA57]